MKYSSLQCWSGVLEISPRLLSMLLVALQNLMVKTLAEDTTYPGHWIWSKLVLTQKLLPVS